MLNFLLSNRQISKECFGYYIERSVRDLDSNSKYLRFCKIVNYTGENREFYVVFKAHELKDMLSSREYIHSDMLIVSNYSIKVV